MILPQMTGMHLWKVVVAIMADGQGQYLLREAVKKTAFLGIIPE